MKATELRDKSAQELQDERLALRKEQFNLRMQKAGGQLAKTSQLKGVRRNIARVKTVLDEKARKG